MREARTLARLDHPGIIRIHDFGEAGGLRYFLMEYVDGVNLRQVIRDRQLAPARALSIIPQICDALQYAHDEGIIHRDIKPENILIDSKGRVKVADFGLAKLMDRTPADPTLTGTHQIMGTPHYMAPEQIEKPLTVDRRTDIYALGVLFYELLTGELPLGQFSPPSQKSGTDVRLDAVVLQALAREPERRFQQARELKVALEAFAPLETAIEPVAKVQSLPPRSVPIIVPDVGLGGDAPGMLTLEGDALILEYKRSFAWLMRMGLNEVRIPLAQITHLQLKRGWFSYTLIIRTARASVLGKLPNSTPGQAVIRIPRAEAEAGERFVSALRGSVPVELPPPEAPQTAAGPGIFLLFACLLLSAIVILAWASILSFALMQEALGGGRDPLGTLFAVLGLGVAGIGVAAFVAVGALKLRHFESYAWVVTAVVLAALITLPFVIGLAIGIIGFLVLRRPAVRAAFARRAASPEGAQVPATLWCTLTALAICLAGAALCFRPDTPWVKVQTEWESSTYTLLVLHGSDFVAPILGGIVFLGMFLLLVATARIRPYTLVRPLGLILGAGIVLFLLAMDFQVNLDRVVVADRTDFRQGDTSNNKMQWTEGGSLRAVRHNLPMRAEGTWRFAKYSVGGSNFEVPVGNAVMPGLLEMLAQKTQVRPQASPYLASGLAAVLLLIAAIQAFLILGRSEPDRAGAQGGASFVGGADPRNVALAVTPPPQPAPAPRVRSLFGEIYSLMFESRR
jgi:hypothetical protein